MMWIPETLMATPSAPCESEMNLPFEMPGRPPLLLAHDLFFPETLGHLAHRGRSTGIDLDVLIDQCSRRCF